GDLASGAQATVELVVTPNQTGSIDDTATVSSSTSDPDPSNDSATATTEVDAAPVAQADLSITKSHSGDFTAGSPGTYTLAVHNAGPSDAQGPVTITDTLPTGETYA